MRAVLAVPARTEHRRQNNRGGDCLPHKQAVGPKKVCCGGIAQPGLRIVPATDPSWPGWLGSGAMPGRPHAANTEGARSHLRFTTVVLLDFVQRRSQISHHSTSSDRRARWTTLRGDEGLELGKDRSAETVLARPLQQPCPPSSSADLQHSVYVESQAIAGSDGHSSCGNQGVPRRTISRAAAKESPGYTAVSRGCGRRKPLRCNRA